MIVYHFLCCLTICLVIVHSLIFTKEEENYCLSFPELSDDNNFVVAISIFFDCQNFQLLQIIEFLFMDFDPTLLLVTLLNWLLYKNYIAQFTACNYISLRCNSLPGDQLQTDTVV